MSYVSPIPVAQAFVTSLRGSRTHPIHGSTRDHGGIDFAVPTGTPVFAATSGTVAASTFQEKGAGNYVKVKHDDGRESLYMHLDARLVNAGQRVAAGQQVGRSGNTGASTGPHLHFEVRQGDAKLDPLDFLPYTYRVSTNLQKILGSDTIRGGAGIGLGVIALAAVGYVWWRRRKRGG